MKGCYAGSVEQIGEAFLLPMLKAMLAQFPFHIRSFHSDNGSEYINHMAAGSSRRSLMPPDWRTSRRGPR
jgi:hypothetical protein